MKVFVIALFALTSFACAEYAQDGLPSVYGYLSKIAVPLAEKIRKAENATLGMQRRPCSSSKLRIAGGLPACASQRPYQAALLSSIIGISGSGLCGGTLISLNRVLSAAHCWNDGVHQAWRYTVILGSTLLFEGGTRIETSAVAVHSDWNPLAAQNDILVVYLPSNIVESDTIAPIALPSGDELDEDFAGTTAIASGYGFTSDDASIDADQYLSHVRLTVITNSICAFASNLNIQDSQLCTSGLGRIGACEGDSGGPLVVSSNDRNILIGVIGFYSPLGCEASRPTIYTRVTSFIDFINQHIN